MVKLKKKVARKFVMNSFSWYIHLSHALKKINTANKRSVLLLHILWYATGNAGMQQVVFHSTFPSLLARNSFLGSFWGSKISSETFQLLWTIMNSSDHIQRFSDNFRILPKISEDFPKILKSHKNSEKHFWTIFEVFDKLPNIPEVLLKILKPFCTISEDFQKIPKIAKKFRSFRGFRHGIK